VADKAHDSPAKCFLCSRTIWPEDPTTTAAGLTVHRPCYDKFVRPSLLPDTPKKTNANTQ
jgi:hypothetical protein